MLGATFDPTRATSLLDLMEQLGSACPDERRARDEMIRLLLSGRIRTRSGARVTLGAGDEPYDPEPRGNPEA